MPQPSAIPTMLPLPEAPVPVSSQVIDNGDGTYTVGDRTIVKETVGRGLQGTDPGADGKFSTDGKNTRQGDGDDGFTGARGWINDTFGTQGNRQQVLIDKYGDDIDSIMKEVNLNDRMFGITRESLESALTSERQKALGKKYNVDLESVGGAKVGYGESEGQVKRREEERRTRGARGKKVKAENAANISNAKADVTATNKVDAQNFLTNTLQIQNANFLRNQEIARQQERLGDRADAKEAKSMEYKLLQEKMDRDDHRYEQELMRYDERKRTETLQSLAGGLAALGAAFAL